MTDDDSRKIADATLNKVKQFTVGLGRAGEKPAAKGSGVLVKQGELTGILTCAHVATHLRELKRPVIPLGQTVDLQVPLRAIRGVSRFRAVQL